MSMDTDFINTLETYQRGSRSYAVATVVAVSGSASARVGAKAIFDEHGQNVHGWVGGGCAERFVSEQVLSALSENRPRIVTARLDDEVLGLGVACGGKMDVFIDPIRPAETVCIPYLQQFSNPISSIAARLGLRLVWGENSKPPSTFADALQCFVQSLAVARNRSGTSLRYVRDLPLRFESEPLRLTRRVLIFGNSRISENLATLLAQSDFSVRVIGPDLKPANYPDQVQCSCLHASFGNIDFSPAEAVVVASQLPMDFGLVADALRARVPYVAMVGSRTRVIDLYQHLGQLGVIGSEVIREPLFAPAGLDIDARGPGEIALSITAEILSLARS